uniref:Insulin-like peptide 2 n=1 Tax=Tritonia tetraquetra TaxID=2780533 RepID=I1SKI3_9GAST|nr:insulin-like peptide 2 precursor [Tritonia tetraquetra]
MNGSIESCVTLTFLLVTFAFMLCQGDSKSCQLTDSPDPQGMCGERLAEAHANLCFLLRRAYPQFFPSSKRASPTSLYNKPALHKNPGHAMVKRDVIELEQLYSIPVSALAGVRLTDENWRSFVYSIVGQKRSAPGENTDEYLYAKEDLEELPDVKVNPTKTLIRMLTKRRSPIRKRSEGLVCECCFNVCRMDQMATYC